MLKITRCDQGASCREVRLEGKLLVHWVDLVRRCFVTTDTSPPRLDVSGVTFVDDAGARLLRELLLRGVRVESCNPYVAELLFQSRKHI